MARGVEEKKDRVFCWRRRPQFGLERRVRQRCASSPCTWAREETEMSCVRNQVDLGS